MIVIPITIHGDVLTSGFNLRQLSMGHLILGGSDQVIPVTIFHDSVTREQVQRVLGAWIEKLSPTKEANNVGLMCSLTIHSSIPSKA